MYIDRGVLEAARRVGLNVRRVSENALVEAIGRLSGQKQPTVPNNQVARLVEDARAFFVDTLSLDATSCLVARALR